jgi:hypothetical protein
MPMTCAAQKSQSRGTDTIEKIIAPPNEEYMQACIYTSLDFLQAEFFAGARSEAIELLRGFVGTAAHAEKVGIFFLLLNIDRQLKEKLMGLDQDHAKLARFFSDLRLELVTVFFCSRQGVPGFVVQCTDGYRIA